MKRNINQAYAYEMRKLIGCQLRQMREDKNLSQQELADKMGMNRTTISKIEDGKWNYGIDTITLFSVHLDFAILLQ